MCVCIYVNDGFYDFYGYWRLVYIKSQLQETWAYEGLSMTHLILMVSKVQKSAMVCVCVSFHLNTLQNSSNQQTKPQSYSTIYIYLLSILTKQDTTIYNHEKFNAEVKQWTKNRAEFSGSIYEQISSISTWYSHNSYWLLLDIFIHTINYHFNT